MVVIKVINTGADPGFFEGGDLGAAEAHLRAPFMRCAHNMRCAHKGCEPSGTGGLGRCEPPSGVQGRSLGNLLQSSVAETQFASISESFSSP